MHQGLCSRLSGLARRFVAAALVLAAGIGTAWATTDEEAAAACDQELRSLGALAIQDVEVRREDRAPSVQGIAEFPDSAGVRFRCRVYNGEVRSLRYLVRNPTVADGWLWVAERPEGAAEAGPTRDGPAPPPAPDERVLPAWRDVGETGPDRDEAAAPQTDGARFRSAGQIDMRRDEPASPPSTEEAAPPASPDQTAGTASPDEPVSPLFLRPPG
jgi:hypothetical protein